ncbi:MAG: DNA polymerase III subunit [Spirochaetes bacterium]|jgi:DNA polymerase-3 subunit delta'|nr:DNA polymerase III subunit [Spirochaetota bacterium]
MNTTGILGHDRQIELLVRMAARDRLPQTMLFAGTDGIGKRLVARRFLASLFCTAPESPCLSCPACSLIERGTHPDFIELGPNERGIIPIGDEDKREEGTVRRLIERLSRRSVSGFTAVIVDGVDRIPEEGQNALLKTIEEPPLSARIILIASNSSRILPTILSRCLVMKFHPPQEEAIRAFLAERGVDAATAMLIAPFAGGSFALAAALVDDARRGEVTALCREMARYLREGDSFDPPVEKAARAADAETVLDALVNFFRWNLVALESGIAPPVEFDGLALSDSESLFGLVKILLALKKGQSHNLNLRIGLKGMLYSLYPGGDHAPGPGIST